jgi:hypothetical protein
MTLAAQNTNIVRGSGGGYCVGRAEVALSWDGAHCSVVWPEEGEYAVYATEPLASKAPWRQLARGSGVAVAWASASSTFAVLHVPKVTAVCTTQLPSGIPSLSVSTDKAA